MKTKLLLLTLGLVQLILGLRVVKRLLLTSQGERLQPVPASARTERHTLSVIMPVLNEYTRLVPCLSSLQERPFSLKKHGKGPLL